MSLKRIFPIILLVWPYLIFPQFLMMLSGEDAVRSYAIGYEIMTVVICALNIIYAWTYKSQDSYKDLAFWNMLIRLVYIPFYIIIFIIEIVLLSTSIIAGFGSILAIEIIFLVICLLVTSPMYGVSAVIQAKKRGLVPSEYAVLHSILHFIIIASLVSSIVLYAKLGKIHKQQKHFYMMEKETSIYEKK